jgi:hypothetical protein
MVIQRLHQLSDDYLKPNGPEFGISLETKAKVRQDITAFAAQDASAPALAVEIKLSDLLAPLLTSVSKFLDEAIMPEFIHSQNYESIVTVVFKTMDS